VFIHVKPLDGIGQISEPPLCQSQASQVFGCFQRDLPHRVRIVMAPLFPLSLWRTVAGKSLFAHSV